MSDQRCRSGERKAKSKCFSQRAKAALDSADAELLYTTTTITVMSRCWPSNLFSMLDQVDLAEDGGTARERVFVHQQRAASNHSRKAQVGNRPGAV